jgi:hypothetical protein
MKLRNELFQNDGTDQNHGFIAQILTLVFNSHKQEQSLSLAFKIVI